MTEQIKITREGAVEVIAFANPPKNFISTQMLKEFYRELLRVSQDSSVRGLVLTGGIKDSFLTHYDVSELIEYSKNAPKATGRVGNILVCCQGSPPSKCGPVTGPGDGDAQPCGAGDLFLGKVPGPPRYLTEAGDSRDQWPFARGRLRDRARL
jgi:hypothetical protein